MCADQRPFRSGIETPRQPAIDAARHNQPDQPRNVDLVKKGLGWAFIPEHLLADAGNRDLCVLPHEYQRSAFLKAVDLLWSLRSRQTDVIAWLNGDLAKLRTLFALR